MTADLEAVVQLLGQVPRFRMLTPIASMRVPDLPLKEMISVPAGAWYRKSAPATRFPNVDVRVFVWILRPNMATVSLSGSYESYFPLMDTINSPLENFSIFDITPPLP